MARRINSRLIIKGTLEAITPLHVGGYGADVDTDLPLARNGKNRLYVPGTSIAGVLRSWCEKNFTEKDKNGNDVPLKLIGELFGPKRKPGVEEGHASFVLIEDAVLPEDAETEIRDGVGIERFYGTAADMTKFDRAILPKGNTFEIEMTVEIDKDEARTKAIFGHLLSALSKEEIRFGGAKTRGLGRVKFELKDGIEEEKFIGFENILSLFEDSKKTTLTIQNLIDADSNTNTNPAHTKLEIEIGWEPVLPLMNKAGYEGIGADMLPVTSGVKNGELALVLAGSSIKGVFRAQAERIMRTLTGITAKGVSDFNKQIDDIPVVENLFGARKKTKSPNAKLGRGALTIDDCYSTESFSRKTWREAETAKVTKTDTNGKETEASYTEQELWQKLEVVGAEMKRNRQAATSATASPDPHFHVTHHTAIDRFTGSVAEGALYSVLAPHNIGWEPIKMSLDFGRTDGKEKQCLMLLLLVLRDLAQNRLPLGFAANRGMGEVKINRIDVSGSYKIRWENGKFVFADEKQKEEITKEWQKQ
jgi:CRISPR/Cas system CSM-associated protein Csm3 (group 7 of RAMP superfamily)